MNMKTVLIIIGILIGINCNAQYEYGYNIEDSIVKYKILDYTIDTNVTYSYILKTKYDTIPVYLLIIDTLISNNVYITSGYIVRIFIHDINYYDGIYITLDENKNRFKDNILIWDYKYK